MPKTKVEMTEKELQALLSEVTEEFQKSISLKEDEKLAKSEDEDKDKKDKKDKKDEEKEKKDKEAKKAEDEDDEDEEKEKKDKEAKKAEDEDDEDEDEEDEKYKDKEMEKKAKKAKKSEEDEDYGFDSLTKSERAARYKSLKRLIWADQGTKVEKAETKEVEAGTEDLEKSEEIKELKKDAADKDKKIEELSKSVGEITKALDFWVNGPDRKSVADVSEIVDKPGAGDSKKSLEGLNPAELKDKVGSIDPGKLSKNEREAVNDYYIHGEREQEIIKILEKN